MTGPIMSANPRVLSVTSQVTQNDKPRQRAIDARATRHEGYAMSQ
jgi:hypothetical protein